MRRLLPCLAVLLVLLVAGGPAVAEDVPAWAKVSEAQKNYAATIGIPVAFENHIGMRFVLIPPGSFRMGAPKMWIREHASDQHRPWPHDVEITRPYYLQINEVTNAQYRTLVPKHVSEGDGAIKMNADEQPATTVAWVHARDFLKELSEHDPKRRRYRLPSEAEWEMAARAGTKTTWYWGIRPTDAHEYEQLADGIAESTGPAAVGSFRPNPWGLHDMLGNVSEFTADAAVPFASYPATDPRSASAAGEPQLETLFRRRIVRGGKFTHGPESVRPWIRASVGTWSGAGRAVGFRAVVPVLRDPPIWRTLPCDVRSLAGEDGTQLKVKTSYETSHENYQPMKGGRFDLTLHERHDAYRWKFDLPRGRRLWFDSWQPSEAYVYFDAMPFARRIRYDVPMYRLIEVKGTLEIREGESASGQIVWFERLAAALAGSPDSSEPTCVAVSDEKGHFRVGNIPWMPGVPVTLMGGPEVHAHRYMEMAEVELVMPDVYRPVITLDTRMQLDPDVVFFREGSSSAFGIGGGEPPAKYRPFSATAGGSVSLACKHPDGRPLVGAFVLRNPTRNEEAFPAGSIMGLDDIAITGPEGQAEFPAVPPGAHVFELIAPGRPRAVKSFTIKPGRITKHDLVLPAPAAIRLRVLAPSGRPAAWAEFDMRSPIHRKWHNVDPSGTQLVGKMCDCTGRATLYNLPAGPQKIHVRWLGHHVEFDVDPSAGKTQDVTVRLEAP